MKKLIVTLCLLVMAFWCNIIMDAAVAEAEKSQHLFVMEEDIDSFMEEEIIASFEEWEFSEYAAQNGEYVAICDTRMFIMASIEGSYGDLGIYYGSKEGWYILFEHNGEEIILPMRYEDVIFDNGYPYLHISVLCRLYRACQD